MNISLYIAKRYLLTKSSNNAINIITIIAALGVIISSAALFVVLSGFAGLKDFSLQFTSLVDPDLNAEVVIGKSYLLTPEQEQKLSAINGVASYSKIIEERVVLSYDGKKLLATLKGVDANYPVVTAIDSLICNLDGSKTWKRTN